MTQPDKSDKAAERVTERRLKELVCENFTPLPSTCLESARAMARELIEQRASSRYRQHLPGCDIFKHPTNYLKTSDGCTCGYDQLPQHIRGET